MWVWCIAIINYSQLKTSEYKRNGIRMTSLSKKVGENIIHFMAAGVNGINPHLWYWERWPGETSAEK